jgi:hypothetical protein
MSGGEVNGNTSSASTPHSFSTNSSVSGGGVVVSGGTFSMSGGTVSGNTASSSSGNGGSSYGGGVCVHYGTFTLNGGEVSGNTASTSNSFNFSRSGGGVYVSDNGIFTKQLGAVIYGSDESDNTLKNTAGGSGDAVFVAGSPAKILNTTAGRDITLGNLNSYSIGISGITYSGTWILESNGNRKSPAISNGGITKERISFTSIAANAYIAVQLDVSSESGYDYAFISALDNGSVASTGGYYTGSRISGTESVRVSIPVPAAGSHFIDIGYQKDGSQTGGSDCAWFKVVE